MAKDLDAGVQTQINDLVQAGSGGRVLSELAAFTRLLAESSQLARALAEPDTPVEAKRALLVNVLGGRFDDATVDLIAQTSGNRDVIPKNLAELLLQVLTVVAFATAEADGSLQDVEKGLSDFGRAVQTSPELRDTLSNPGVQDDLKQAVLADLLRDKLNDKAAELVRTLVVLSHGREADGKAFALADAAAARRNKVVAEIRSAVELDDDRKARLVAALESSVGKSVEGRFTVDPSILGSVVVRVGDEVLDGSVRHRLEQAKVALLGAS